MTDEDISLVDDFVTTYDVSHPLAVMPKKELEALVMGSGFPSSGVFANGKLIWKGHPSEAGSAINDALAEAEKGSVYPKKLKKVRALMQKGENAKALAEVIKLEEKGLEGEDAAWAERIRKYMVGTCDRHFEKAKLAADEGRIYEGVTLVQDYADKKSPFPQAEAIGAWLLELEADENFKYAMAGGELYAEAQALEKAGEYVEAFKTYDKAISKAKDARIGALAREAALLLVSERHTGFKDSCPNCDGKVKAACEKHFEELSL